MYTCDQGIDAEGLVGARRVGNWQELVLYLRVCCGVYEDEVVGACFWACVVRCGRERGGRSLFLGWNVVV